MRACDRNVELRFGFGFQHLAATVETGGADVVAQMDFARGGLNSDTWNGQRVVRAVHAALGRRFFVLLDGHDPLLGGKWVGKHAGQTQPQASARNRGL